MAFLSESIQIFYVWATFVIKIVTQNYQKSPYLVTLLALDELVQSNRHSQVDKISAEEDWLKWWTDGRTGTQCTISVTRFDEIVPLWHNFKY